MRYVYIYLSYAYMRTRVLTKATPIYPAKCDCTFGGTLLFIVGRTEDTTFF